MYIKKVMLMVVLLLSLLVGVNVKSVGAASANKLVIHYYRYDETIGEYDLWLWPSGGEGTNYAFNGTDSYGSIASIDLTSNNLEGASSIGVIVKKNNPWEKDINSDRFINMSNPNSSEEVHVYLLQGEEFISYVNNDTVSCDRDVFNDPLECAQVIEVKLLDTYFNDSLNIEFSASVTVSSDDVVILKDGNPVGYTGFTSGTSGTLVLDEAVDVTARYELQVDLGEKTDTSIIRVGNDYDSEIFQNAYNYDGTLGAIYGGTETTFKLWAPVSSNVELNLYNAGHTIATRIDGDDTAEVHQMTYLEKGVWEVTIEGDLHGMYYTFNVVNNGTKVSDIQDPYSLSLGVNGLRSMVVNFDAINPEGWDSDSGINGFTSPNNSIIYEIHIRDLTSQAA